MIEPRMITVMFLLFGGHAADILFTVLLIRKYRDRYENPEEIEINYHRWFFKKFGLVKGAMMSATISFSYMILVVAVLAYLDAEELLFFVAGFSVAVGYINAMNYVMDDEVRKKLVRKEKA